MQTSHLSISSSARAEAHATVEDYGLTEDGNPVAPDLFVLAGSVAQCMDRVVNQSVE